MKVILNNDVENLGEEGDICVVKPGYARNYLLPKGLVMEYNERNVALIEERRAVIEERKAEKRKQASGLKERIESEPLKISMTAGTNGKLFGSVNAATIVERLAANGIEIERKRVEVPDNAIKTTGNFKVRIRLYGDHEATLTVSVEASNAREIAKEKEKEQPREEPEASPVEESADGSADESAEAEHADTDAPAEEEVLDPEVIAMRAAAEEAVDEPQES
jgi:large subunit ribosomal protein L9